MLNTPKDFQTSTEQLLWENALAAHKRATTVLNSLRDHPAIMLKHGAYWVRRLNELEQQYPALKQPW